MSILKLIRQDLKVTAGYEVSAKTLPFRLHANELPWSPLEHHAIALNQYPGTEQEQALTEVLAKFYNVEPEQLLLTRGSDEGLDFLMRFFLQSRVDSIIQCPPTFSMYSFYAQLQQAKVINCALSESDFGIDINNILSAWEPNCKLVMLCRPNNPTGSGVSLGDVEQLCLALQNKAIVVVDEAYIEFSKELSAVYLLNQFDNLIILRTLSKACGLAGLRLGSIITQTDTIKALRTLIPPYTLSNVVVDLAYKALKDQDWFMQSKEMIIKARENLRKALHNNVFVEKVYSSQANFILIKSPYAVELASWFAQQGIAIRTFATIPRLQHCLRITVGDFDLNNRLLDALASFQPEVR